MRDAAIKAVKDSEISFKDENEDARKYKIVPQLRVMRKVPPELYGVPIRVVNSFLGSKVSLYSTNADMMETVRGWIPHHDFPSNYMDKRLSPKQLTDIASIMAGKDLLFDIKKHNSLSKIKLAIQAGQSASDAEIVYKGTIAFGKDYIVVGSKRFPFATGADYHRVKVGDQKLRVDVLRALLEAGNLPSSSSKKR
jgi:hypothetical protein